MLPHQLRFPIVPMGLNILLLQIGNRSKDRLPIKIQHTYNYILVARIAIDIGKGVSVSQLFLTQSIIEQKPTQ
jgi:hypothetical protein